MIGAKTLVTLTLLAGGVVAASAFGVFSPERLASRGFGDAVSASAASRVVVGTLMFRFWRLGEPSRHYFRWASDGGAVGRRTRRTSSAASGGASRSATTAARRSTSARACISPCASAIALLLALGCIDARALGLLGRFGQRSAAPLPVYCPEPDAAPAASDDPNAPGCELMRRAYALGYAKSARRRARSQQKRAAQIAPCTRRQRDEPALHYAWRLLAGSWANLRRHAAPSYFAGVRRDFDDRVAHLGSLGTRATADAGVGAARVAPHVDQPARSGRRRLHGANAAPIAIAGCAHRPAPPAGATRASKVFEHVAGAAPVREPVRARRRICREYHVHWGAPLDSCQRLAPDPDAVLAAASARGDGRRRARSLSHGDELPSWWARARRPTVPQLPVLLRERRRAGARRRRRSTLAGAAASPSKRRACRRRRRRRALYVDRYDAVATLLVHGFHYGALLSEAGARAGGRRGAARRRSPADDFLLTRALRPRERRHLPRRRAGSPSAPICSRSIRTSGTSRTTSDVPPPVRRDARAAVIARAAARSRLVVVRARRRRREPLAPRRRIAPASASPTSTRALAAVRATPAETLAQASDYARELMRRASCASERRAARSVECLMTAARRYCRQARRARRSAAPSTWTSSSATSSATGSSSRTREALPDHDAAPRTTAASWRDETRRIQGALAVDFRLRMGRRATTTRAWPRGIDRYCLATGDEQRNLAVADLRVVAASGSSARSSSDEKQRVPRVPRHRGQAPRAGGPLASRAARVDAARADHHASAIASSSTSRRATTSGWRSHPEVKKAAIAAIEQWGVGLASPRMAAGTLPLHAELERALAQLLGTSDALVYRQRLSRQHRPVRVAALRSRLSLLRRDRCGPAWPTASACAARASTPTATRTWSTSRIACGARARRRFRVIATDGVFPLSGLVANLRDIYGLAAKYNALVVVDDSQGIGVIGEHGRGTHERARPRRSHRPRQRHLRRRARRRRRRLRRRTQGDGRLAAAEVARLSVVDGAAAGVGGGGAQGDGAGAHRAAAARAARA